MNLRQRFTLRHGLRSRTHRPALQTSELRDPLTWVAAIAVCAAFLLLVAAIEYREDLEEARECAAATR
jgi:hypothetical protein